MRKKGVCSYFKRIFVDLRDTERGGRERGRGGGRDR